ITTKRGRFNQPLSIDFNSNLTIADKPDLNYLPWVKPSDEIDVEQMLFKNKYNSTPGTSPSSVYSPVYEILFKQQNGTLSAEEATAQINALRNQDVKKDFDKYFYQKGVSQQYSLGLRAGTASYSWSLSGGYDKNVNQLAAKSDRLNLNWINTFRPVKGLELTGGIRYTQTNATTGKPDISAISNESIPVPYLQLADANGNALPVAKSYRINYIDTAGGGHLQDWKYYPLDDWKHAQTNTKTQDATLDFGAKYSILNGLNASVNYQYERQSLVSRNLNDADSYFTRNLINTYSQLNTATGVVSYGIPVGGILRNTNGTLESSQIRGQLSYDKTWGKHQISVIAGEEIHGNTSTNFTNGLYGYNDNNGTFANVDYRSALSPNYFYGYPQQVPNYDSNSQLTTHLLSTYGNASYTYNNKYTVSGSFRRDASNLFGVNSNDKWNPFWSVGAAWNASSEKFYHFALVPYLRLRTTFGYSGNTNTAIPAVTTIMYGSNSAYTNLPTSSFSNYYNPDLTWEKSGQLNIGLDFAVVKQIISGSIEYYHKNNTNLFGRSLLDYTSGIGSIVKNVASTKGNGWDIVLKSRNIDRTFKWFTNLNLSFNKDVIENYYVSSNASQFVYTNAISTQKGFPVYSIYSYKFAGLDPANGDPQGILNGKVSKDYDALTGNNLTFNDLAYSGSATPLIYGSMGNTFTYKNVSLSVALLYKFKYFFRKETINYSNFFSDSAGNSDYYKRWQRPGDENSTTVPSLVYPSDYTRDNFYSYSEATIDKGDLIRLQYINLNYDLVTARNSSKQAFKSLQLYVNCANLGLIWRANKDGLDPEYYGGTNIPTPKSYSVGVRATLK
ncbi:MAG TPA: TonB-dependent receptor, partial [Pedobacter sp.]